MIILIKVEEDMTTRELISMQDSLRENLANEKTQYKDDIFHYTSPEGFKSILDGNIWFSNIKFLNDKSEDNYIYSLFPVKELDFDKDFFKITQDIKDAFEKNECYKNNGQSFSKSNFYVASFSKNPDCLELWNYYTRSTNGIGYNIGFHQKCLFLINFYHIKGAMFYKEDEQKELLNKILKKHNIFYIQHKEFLKNDENNKIFINNLINLFELHNLFFKHPAYENEQEYRYIIYDNDSNAQLIKQYLKHRLYNGLFIPYIEIPFNKLCLNSIKISPNSDNILFQEGVKSLLSEKEYYEIKITNSQIPKRY